MLKPLPFFTYLYCYFLLSTSPLLGFQPTPSEIHLAGMVVDTTGHPVENATLSWFPVEGRPAPRPEKFSFPSCESNANGEFKLTIPTKHPAVGNGYFGDARIAISKPGYRVAIHSASRMRFLSDAPVVYQLEEVQESQVVIYDAKGVPLPDAEVFPATVDGQTIPYSIAKRLASRSDSQGVVTMREIEPNRLSHLYLRMDSNGLQRVPVAWQEGKLVAQMAPMYRFTGKVVPPPGATVDLEKIKLLFVAANGVREWSLASLYEADVARDGTFQGGMTDGTEKHFYASLPSDFPYTFDYVTESPKLNGVDQQLEFQLSEAIRVEGRVIDNATGEGVEGVAINNGVAGNEGRGAFSDQDGKFSFFVPSGAYPFYPVHPWGTFESPSFFYLYPQEHPQGKVLRLGPTNMIRRSQVMGHICDESGTPTPAAEILCSFKKERFSVTKTLYSNQDGTFLFAGVLPNTAVTLNVRTNSLSTLEPINLLLNEDATPKLILKALPKARYTGLVTNLNGEPISGAQVTIRKGIVSEEEAFGGEDRYASNLFGLERFSTDASGRFTSSTTFEWDQDTSLQVDVHGFETYYGPWKKRISDSTDKTLVPIEPIRMTPLPSRRTLRTAVVDENGSAIEVYRVVFLGVKSGLVKRHVQSPSDAEFQLLDSPQIGAVIADGYLPDVHVFDQLPTEETRFRLRPVGTPTSQRQSATWTEEQRREFLKELFTLVPEPAPTDTFYKKGAYYPTLISVDPTSFVTRIKQGEIIGKQMELLQPFTEVLLRMPTEELLRLVPDLNHELKTNIYLELAKRAQQTDEREKYLSEALLSVRQLGGDEHLYGISYVACKMLEFGMVDLARETLGDTFTQHRELSAVLQRGDRSDETKQGVARFFTPEYAIVDPAIAFRLIELGAYENEIDSLRSQAIAFIAASGGAWKEAFKKWGADHFEPNGLNDYTQKLPFTDAKFALEIAELLPATAGKANFLLHVAEKATSQDLATRIQLAQLALKAIQEQKDVRGAHPSHLAAEGAVLVREWDPVLAEQFLFESLWHCEKDNRITPFNLTSELAKRLARYDQQMARTLVTPCFDNWSWLFKDDNNVTYRWPEPLLALSAIDPEETLARTKRLFAEELADKPSRQYAILEALTEEWTKRP